ncbi:hypothetical protein DL93DRAFT_1602995 [Clavulina sp. PMI_390]|nr:hypothetical protein DL93DRAFT_1602995 [Clavulina sp. PMI_390]
MTKGSINFEDKCPFDILFLILELLDRPSVRTLNATSRYLRGATESKVFSTYTLETYGGVGGDLLARSEAILQGNRAEFVTSCYLTIDGRVPRQSNHPQSGPTFSSDPFSNDDATILKRSQRLAALRAMKNLKRLTIAVHLLDNVDCGNLLHGLLNSIGGADSVYIPPFQLQAFCTDAILPIVSDFIRSQSSSLLSLTLPTTYKYHPLSSDLPKLASIEGPGELVSRVAPKRPLQRVVITDNVNQSSFIRLLESLKSSGTYISPALTREPVEAVASDLSALSVSGDSTAGGSPSGPPNSPFDLTIRLLGYEVRSVILVLYMDIRSRLEHLRMTVVDPTASDEASPVYAGDLQNWVFIGVFEKLRSASFNLTGGGSRAIVAEITAGKESIRRTLADTTVLRKIDFAVDDQVMLKYRQEPDRELPGFSRLWPESKWLWQNLLPGENQPDPL